MARILGSGRLVILLLLAGFTLVSAVLVLWRADQVMSEFELEALTLVQRLQTELESAVHAGSEDLVFLAESPEARAAADQLVSAHPQLEALFLAYAKARRQVFQVRLLGADGQELLRIERSTDGGLTRAVHLQNKAKRYYFSQTSELSRGEVFVSELDLNIEEGKIERPLRPTLRFATPIRADSGQLRGVIVVNRSGQDLIDGVERSHRQLPGTLVLVDRQGSYLFHPDRRKEWGGREMLNTGERLSRDHPSIGAWYTHVTSDRTLRTETWLAARGSTSSSDNGPWVLLLTPMRAALSHRAREFVPLGLGLIAAALLIVFGLLSWNRQRELALQIARETALREQIAAREENLREAQDRLVASARLAALTESAAALAHELRNPLGAIINSVALLKSGETMSASDQALLGVVLGESERLERAVSEFLDLSRRPRRRVECFELNDTVGQVLKLAEQDLGPDIHLVSHLSSQPLKLEADPDEVRQVLWNLLQNARAANLRSKGRRIVVHTATEHRGSKLGVQLEVRDEGPGLEADGDEIVHSPSAWGTGLGLIVVAGIAAHYSGHFEIRDRVDARGATARVWLPLSTTETPWQPS